MTSPESAPGPRLRLGISACLTGDRTRYDAGHKYDPYLMETMGQFVDWVPVCPEVEMGLSVPREPMDLVGDPNAPRLMARETGRDLTDGMRSWALARVQQLGQLDLDGFVLKSRSPSCGLNSTPVYDGEGVPVAEDRGLFAQELRRGFPLLPVVEDAYLYQPGRRENFIERIFGWHRWREFMREDPTPGGLVRFHTAHKMALLAHSTEAYRRLGRLVARSGATSWELLSGDYIELFMEALQVPTTPGRHANVLQHLLGFLKHDMEASDRAELLEMIEEYRQGRLPLVVPVTLLKHHLRRHRVPDWVHEQVYLNPYPVELMLRNHA